MPCQYCSFPQTKGEWWDWGFGFLLPRRTKWRQIIRKLWTSGNGPSGACWGHHSEMCYSSYILWTNTWLTGWYSPLRVCILIHFCITQKSETCCFSSFSDSLAHSVLNHCLHCTLSQAVHVDHMFLPPLENIISNSLRTGGGELKPYKTDLKMNIKT